MMAKLKCVCKHSYQDEKDGKEVRLHNTYRRGLGGYRCTVCGNEKPFTEKKQ